MGQITIVEDFFDTKILANPDDTGLLQQEGTLLWRFEGEELNLRDSKALKKKMETCRKEARFREVKHINQILTQLDFANGKVLVDHYPEILQVEHSERCNARCIMCNHYFTRNQDCHFMDIEVIRQLETVLPYAQMVGLNGIGEPLLHPQIMELMSMYEKYEVKLTTNTNMSVMNPELAAIMHRTFADIQISCDACDAETYETIRKGLKFETFIKNTKMLRVAGDTEICMATVVMRQNLTQLPKIVEFAADLGCDKLVMLDLNTSGLLRNIQDAVGNYPKTAAYYMEKARETAEKKGIFLHTLDYVHGISSVKTREEELAEMEATEHFHDDTLAEELYQLYEKLGFSTPLYPALDTDYCTASDCRSKGYCLFIENRPFISAKGDVFNCCTRRMHSMGNIHERSFADVWNGPEMQKMRQIQLEGYLPKYCVGCAYMRGNLMEERLRIYDEKAYMLEDQYDRLRMRMIKQKMGENV